MAVPIIAIVGRPNVGKSTLFNRIIRRRRAIVDAVSGVTRDRHYAEAEWCGRAFIIADTGGFLTHFQNDIDRGVRFQVEEAVDEADIVLLVTDVRSGVTTTDQVMGGLLHKSGKTTVVAVNKVDTPALEVEAGVFMQLGFGEPHLISALHGRGTGDMLDALIERLPAQAAPEEATGEIAVAVLGRPNVGKSSLVNALLGREKMLVTAIPGTTRDSVDSFVKRYGQTYRLIDTAGLRKRRKVHESIEYYSTLRSIRSLDRCHVAVIMVDAREGVLNQDLKIIDMAVEARRGIIIALNKWDLVTKTDKTFVEAERAVKNTVKGNDYIEVISTSALTGQRTYKLLDLCRRVYAEWSRTIETGTLNRMLETAVKRNHPPAHRGRQITIKYCTQTGSSPPAFTFFANKPAGIPVPYRRYLSRQIRESFGFAGVPFQVLFKKK